MKTRNKMKPAAAGTAVACVGLMLYEILGGRIEAL